MALEKPTDEELAEFNNMDELRGCRQVSDISIETVEPSHSKSPVTTPRSGSAKQSSQHPSLSSSLEDGGEGCSYASVASGKVFHSIKSPSEELETRLSSPDEHSATHGKMISRPKSATPKLPSTLEFTCGNPNVERVQGILHIHKDRKVTTMNEEGGRSELVCMLAVPSSFTLHDLLLFTDHVYQGIEYMKIIKDVSPNTYMALIKFKTQTLADEFYINYNNARFNSIEPDICHLVYVARVDFLKGSQGGAMAIPGLIELPNCPVCLERMDESVDGILTILCNHSFHSRCLAGWSDTSCPVCRYCQTPESSGENYCFECQSTESLWICLICGQVGCGRYVDGHAYGHFMQTNHMYAMQLSNGRVWDYVGDNYVHRLVQNKDDGKLVEMDEHGQRVSEEKIDSLTLEYTYLLTNQLESQRHYFEEKMSQLEKEFTDKISRLEEERDSAVMVESEFRNSLTNTQKTKDQLEKKCEQLSTQLKKVLRQLQDEQALNKSLTTNQNHWLSKVEKLEQQKTDREQELRETQEQLKDIMFHLEAQNKLTESSEVDQQEIAEGAISVGEDNSNRNSRRLRRKR